MGRRKFTPEFKLEAVKLVQERGMTVTQASWDLVNRPGSSGDFSVWPTSLRREGLAVACPRARNRPTQYGQMRSMDTPTRFVP